MQTKLELVKAKCGAGFSSSFLQSNQITQLLACCRHLHLLDMQSEAGARLVAVSSVRNDRQAVWRI